MTKWKDTKRKGSVVGSSAWILGTGISVQRVYGEPDDKWFLCCAHWFIHELDSKDLNKAKIEALMLVKQHLNAVIDAIGDES